MIFPICSWFFSKSFWNSKICSPLCNELLSKSNHSLIFHQQYEVEAKSLETRLFLRGLSLRRSQSWIWDVSQVLRIDYSTTQIDKVQKSLFLFNEKVLKHMQIPTFLLTEKVQFEEIYDVQFVFGCLWRHSKLIEWKVQYWALNKCIHCERESAPIRIADRHLWKCPCDDLLWQTGEIRVTSCEPKLEKIFYVKEENETTHVSVNRCHSMTQLVRTVLSVSSFLSCVTHPLSLCFVGHL